jgi:hypothetical protein
LLTYLLTSLSLEAITLGICRSSGQGDGDRQRWSDLRQRPAGQSSRSAIRWHVRVFVTRCVSVLLAYSVYQVLSLPCCCIVAGRSSVQYAPGPSYTTAYQPADIDGSQSQSRHSAATTLKNQVSSRTGYYNMREKLIKRKAGFRNMVLMRDIHCLMTEEFCIQCEAAHIVPQSRPDVSVPIHLAFIPLGNSPD